MSGLGSRWMLAAALVLATGSAHAAEAPTSDEAALTATLAKDLLTIDLATARRLARSNNDDIAAAAARVRAAQAAVTSSVGSMLPTVGVGVSAVGLEGAVSSAGTYTVGHFHHVSPFAVANWVLNPAEAVFDLLAARRQRQAARAAGARTAQDVDWQVTLAWYDLALAQARVGAATSALDAVTATAALAKARARAGLALPLDAVRGEAEVAAARTRQIDALDGWQAASLRLAGLLELDPAVLLVPAKGGLAVLPTPAPTPPLADLLAQALAQRPDLAGLRAQLGASDARHSAALFTALSPQLSASALTADRPPTGALTDTEYREPIHTASLALTLSAAGIGRIAAANAARALARIEVRRQLEGVRSEVVAARTARESARAELALAEPARSSAALAVTQQASALTAGLSLGADTLAAKAALVEANLRATQATARLLAAEATLAHALGQ